MDNIIIKEDSIENAVKVNNTITEFGAPYKKEYFSNRCKNKKHLILVVYIDKVKVGYMISYDKDNDCSFYCWMAGVDPKFRGKGILKEMMNYLFKRAKNNNYKKISIKTRNNRREMLGYLIKNNFNFIEVQNKENIEENRILLEKLI